MTFGEQHVNGDVKGGCIMEKPIQPLCRQKRNVVGGIVFSFLQLLLGFIHHICNGSSSHVLQTKLIAQSHEERSKFELPVHQIVVLCVIPTESKLDT